MSADNACLASACGLIVVAIQVWNIGTGLAVCAAVLFLRFLAMVIVEALGASMKRNR